MSKPLHSSLKVSYRIAKHKKSHSSA